MLSVIIPIYNTGKYLPQCLDSIINQRYEDIEIICINDGSSDNSGEILKEYAKKDNRIKIIEQKNLGQSSARNAGLEIAKGEFITFVDSDDFLDTDCYEYVMKYAEASDLICFGIKLFGDAHMEKRFSDNEYYKIKYDGFCELNDEIIMQTDCSPCNKIFKKDIIDKYKIRFPEGLNYEDAAFYWKYCLCINNAYFIKKCFYNYRRISGSIMDKTFNRKSEIAIDHLRIAQNVYEFLLINNKFSENISIYIELFKSCFYFAYNYSSKSSRKKVLQLGNDILNQMEIPAEYIKNEYLLKNLKLKKYYKISGKEKVPFLQRIFSIKSKNSKKVIRILGFKITTKVK